MNVDFLSPWGKLVHRTSDVEGEDRTLINPFPRVPLAILYEGNVYGDTGTYSKIGGESFRVYRERYRIPEHRARD